MNILISNDDGYLAPGIQELRRAMMQFGEVTVIAPEKNQSGASNSLTLHNPLRVEQVQENVYYVTGTPSDCVHIAMTGFLKEKPDIVLSGINNGQNMGDDVLYSGTVAAAMEGYLFGCPSFAFSQIKKGWSYLDSAVRVTEKIIGRYVQDPLPGPFLLNVNIPNMAEENLLGAVITRLGRRHSAQSVIEEINPRGERIFWMGAAGDAKDNVKGTDFWAVAHGYVSMTPLQVDMTNYEQLEEFRTWWNNY